MTLNRRKRMREQMDKEDRLLMTVVFLSALAVAALLVGLWTLGEVLFLR